MTYLTMRKTRLELQNQHIFKLSMVENIVKKKNKEIQILYIGSPKNQGFWLLNPKRSLNPAVKICATLLYIFPWPKSHSLKIAFPRCNSINCTGLNPLPDPALIFLGKLALFCWLTSQVDCQIFLPCRQNWLARQQM